MKNFPFLWLLLWTFCFNAPAQPQIFNIEAQASEVAFSLGDVLHSVHGTFHVRSGAVDFDSNAPKISGAIVVAAGSGKSGNDTRDHKMTSEILDAPHFADISFAPGSYQGSIASSGDSQIQVTGLFTLHGAAHELTVPMQIHRDGSRGTAKTRFMVPYVKWGLKDPSAFVLRVAKEVEIELTLVGSISPRS